MVGGLQSNFSCPPTFNPEFLGGLGSAPLDWPAGGRMQFHGELISLKYFSSLWMNEAQINQGGYSRLPAKLLHPSGLQGVSALSSVCSNKPLSARVRVCTRVFSPAHNPDTCIGCWHRCAGERKAYPNRRMRVSSAKVCFYCTPVVYTAPKASMLGSAGRAD